MGRPILIQSWKNTGTFGVYTYTDGTVTQVGTDFGPGYSSTNAIDRGFNRVAHFAGDLWAVGRGRIWKYDVANSGDWGVYDDYVSDLYTTEGDSLAGFQVLVDGGEPYLYWVYLEVGTSQFIFKRMNKSGTIEALSNVISTEQSSHRNAGTASWSAPINHNNKWAWTHATVGNRFGVSIYDPVGHTMVNANNDSAMNTSSFVGSICSQGLSLYALTQSSANEWALWTVESSNIAKKADLTSGASSVIGQGLPCLLSDDDYLYAFIYTNGTQNGWALKRIEVAATGYIVEDHTYAIPASLRVNNGAASVNNGSAWYEYKDAESVPGSVKIQMLFSPQATAGATVSCYDFNTSAMSMTYCGDGADTFQYAFSVGSSLGGERAWAGSGELDGIVVGQTTNSVDVDLDYQIFGGSGQLVNVEWWYTNTNNGLKNQATILSSQEGTVVGGTIISGVTADSSPKQFKWGMVLDGINTSQNVTLAPRIYEV